MPIIIERVRADAVEDALPGLVSVLRDGVESGASIGFLPPLADGEARAFWREVLTEVVYGTAVLLLARQGDEVVGTVHLALATKPNARHRAEVRKLLVVRRARRQGIARQLMLAIEDEARTEGRTLLVLDTKQGDAAERLYRDLGYIEAGIIPYYARNAEGTLDPTVVFYRVLA